MKILRWCLACAMILTALVPVGSAMPVATPPPAPETEKEVPWYDYDLSEYVTLGDLTAVSASYPEVGVCTEKEIDSAVFQLLLDMLVLSSVLFLQVLFMLLSLLSLNSLALTGLTSLCLPLLLVPPLPSSDFPSQEMLSATFKKAAFQMQKVHLLLTP
jgi:hypothetical protein